MRLFLAICQGAGFSVGAGIRPFLPTLLVGVLAREDLGVDFDGTDYAFLESVGFLFALVAVLFVFVAVERRVGAAALEAGPGGAAMAGIALGLGAVLFAGALAAEGFVSWPGLAGGLLCAAVAHAATRDLFARVRRRLDPAAAGALPLYAEGAGTAVAGLSVPAPPVGLVALLFVLWLLLTGRRREGRKFAGLRVLR